RRVSHEPREGSHHATGRRGKGMTPIRAIARWAGALNVLSAVPDGYSVTVLRRLVNPRDAAATATNILGAEGAVRLGFVADLVGLVLFLASGVLLYEIFKVANRRVAILYLALIVMGTICQGLECVHDLAALVLLKGGAGMSALPVAEAQALALLFL